MTTKETTVTILTDAEGENFPENCDLEVIEKSSLVICGNRILKNKWGPLS